jgi:hypothetical protein
MLTRKDLNVTQDGVPDLVNELLGNEILENYVVTLTKSHLECLDAMETAEVENLELKQEIGILKGERAMIEELEFRLADLRELAEWYLECEAVRHWICLHYHYKIEMEKSIKHIKRTAKQALIDALG